MQGTTRSTCSKTSKQTNNKTHFSVLEAASDSGSLGPDIYPISPVWGTRVHSLMKRPLGGTGHFEGQSICGLLREISPGAGWACRDRPSSHVSPGKEYGQVGICLLASPYSQLGAYLVSSILGDKEERALFVQVPPVQ